MTRLEKLVDIHNNLEDVLSSMVGVIGSRDVREHVQIAMDLIEEEIEELELEENE